MAEKMSKEWRFLLPVWKCFIILQNISKIYIMFSKVADNFFAISLEDYIHKNNEFFTTYLEVFIILQNIWYFQQIHWKQWRMVLKFIILLKMTQVLKKKMGGGHTCGRRSPGYAHTPPSRVFLAPSLTEKKNSYTEVTETQDHFLFTVIYLFTGIYANLRLYI